MLDQIADARMMVMAYHMPFPAVGYIRPQSNHYEWEPILWQFDP
ncbi:MAG: hypothetical protein AAFW75_22285 [Cyanobacteria bacterium J06636_16]